MANEVVIVGGGVSGISAAIWSLKKGLRPILFEKSSRLGGRVSSLYAKDAKKKIDIGQHVLSASYHETKYLLSSIGSLDKIQFQKRLKINFKLDADRSLRFQSWPLPAPAHFFLPLVFSPKIPWAERKTMFRWMLKFRKFSKSQLEKMTVSEWLKEMGHSPFLEKLIWEPVTVATLNTPMRLASSYLLHQVLSKAFLSSYFSSGLGIPVDFLDEIFGKPAHRYITEKGGSVYLRSDIKQLIIKGNSVQSIKVNSDKIFETPNLILATPPDVLARLIVKLPGMNNGVLSNLGNLKYSPIITINLWFKTAIESGSPVSFVDSPIQWLFKLPNSNHRSPVHGYTVVISAAFKEVQLDQRELMHLVEGEFERFFNKNLYSDLGLTDFKIVKEKRATILHSNQLMAHRQKLDLKLSNLQLAGDWVNPDLPATIESAVLSGKQAVSNIASN
jgi:squalene-associated FAD-dependent desaturase